MPELKRIVFVEDDDNLQRIMIKWLKGYEIEAFDNAEDAYEFAAEEAEAGRDIDLFILDIMLRKAYSRAEKANWQYHETALENGIGLGKALRKHKAYADAPIIFLSAKLRKNEDRDTLGDKIQAICFPKPVPYGELQKRIHEILGHPQKSYWQKFAELVGA